MCKSTLPSAGASTADAGGLRFGSFLFCGQLDCYTSAQHPEMRWVFPKYGKIDAVMSEHMDLCNGICQKSLTLRRDHWIFSFLGQGKGASEDF